MGTTMSTAASPSSRSKARLQGPSAGSGSAGGQATALPRDARLIALLLAAAGAPDLEPDDDANGGQAGSSAVGRMLLEFAHRYTHDVLADALVYSDHAARGSSTQQQREQQQQQQQQREQQQQQQQQQAQAPQQAISLEDLRMAIQSRTEGSLLPKEYLLSLASQVNAVPLPAVPEAYAVALPPERERLTAPNLTIARHETPVPLPAFPPATTEPAGGLFGEDEDGQDHDDEDEDDDDDDDEEMEDVTAGIGAEALGSGSLGKHPRDE